MNVRSISVVFAVPALTLSLAVVSAWAAGTPDPKSKAAAAPAKTAGVEAPEKAAEAAAPEKADPPAPAAAPAPGEAEKPDARQVMEEHLALMEKKASTIQAYKVEFYKREYVKGELKPLESVKQEYKKPGCVYLHWFVEPHKGRQALYCKNKYDGELQVKDPSGAAAFAAAFTGGVLSLDPKGDLAMGDNRHPITDAGIFHTLELLRKNFDLAAGNDFKGVTFEVLPDEVVRGQQASCGQTVMPGPPVYYAAKTKICMHKKLQLPVRIMSWDSAGTLVEHYEYAGYEFVKDLPDENFTRERLKRDAPQ